jgi:2-polyprenyl-3-methyl-5-hydroxy-6-metoxy-1,4-benzoquinol methylase
MNLLSINMPSELDCPYLDKDDPWSSHAQIKDWLTDLRPGTRVLDIGVATGTLGKQFAEAGLVMHGIEPHSAWAEVARPYYNDLLCGTLDDASDTFLASHDVVVCADVLEHIADPEQALRRLLPLQSEGCQFLVSVPNIANIWIRLNLLIGRFDYTDRGILDRTHLRFFTRRSLRAMFTSVGLHIVQLSVTPIPLNLIHPFFQQTALGRFVHAVLARLTRALPALLGYQFVVKAVKSRS